MKRENIIVLTGNGFDISNGFKTKFSDFADYYIERKIITELIDVIINRNKENIFFKKNFVKLMTTKGIGYPGRKYDDDIWLYIHEKKYTELKIYLKNHYEVLNMILSNGLFGRLYANTGKHWFDIENSYFKELVEYKNDALKKPSQFNIARLRILNSEFLEIKTEVIKYLKTIDIKINEEILKFFFRHFQNVENVYFVNFNYTSTIKQYLEKLPTSGNIKINHIHGDLESENIVFGYGNDQNKDYNDIKDLEEDEFLRHFKTFDYLNNRNYDKVTLEAINKFPSYEVFVIGHSLGLTDKTLLSEILNHQKCRTIRFFKRKDLIDMPSLVHSKYRDLTYSASRILNSEQELRRKIINYQDITSFP